MDNKTRNAWIDMISKIYADLHNSQRVLNSSNKFDKKRERIIKYFNRLEEVHNKVSETKSEAGEKLLKNFYYDLYIIKPENIPESYFNNQIEIARERGYGNITLSDKDKERMIKQVIDDQKETLDKWIEYFLYDEESKSYEMWEKYWVFQGLQTLGKYDKETYKFSKRDKTTVYPFPPVEREYIFTTLKLMEDFLKDKKTEEDIKNALEAGNFKLLYEYVIKQSMLRGEKQSNSTSGKWIKYEQGSDYNILRNSLQGYYTGWCTAAGENFAKHQLAHGDFYVYYTLDNNGEAKVPRIAIRMDGSTKINEIRGIADNQNMEPEMLPILEEKLKEFPDRDKYYKREHDMKLLTLIDKKVNKNIELSIYELKFLYEMDNEIEGFGWCKDPRIQEIQNKRNQKKDFALIYNINEEEVALTQKEWEENSKQYKILLKDINLNHITSAKETLLLEEYECDFASDSKYALSKETNFSDPLNGNFVLSKEELFFPKILRGSLFLKSLISADSLVLPQIISESLDLKNLTKAKRLVLPKIIGLHLYFDKLSNLDDIIMPEIIGGDLYLCGIEEANNITLYTKVNGCIVLNNLTHIDNLIIKQDIGGYLDLNELISATNLILPEFIGGDLNLDSLKKVENLALPKILKGSLDLNELTNINNLILPEFIGKALDLSSIQNADNLKFPQYIKGFLSLQSLENASNLILPKQVGGYLDLRNLKSFENLILPNEVGINLHLDSLTSANGLVFPSYVGGYIDLRSLQSAEGLKLPYGFNLNRLKCPANVKNEILANPDKYFMEPPINEGKIKILK